MSNALKNLYWQTMARLRFLVNQQWPAWKRYLSIRVATAVDRRSSAPGEKTLLLLAWEFPPFVSGGVYRPVSFARYAADAGWNVSVVCGPAPSAPSKAGSYLVDTIPSAVDIHRIASAPNGPHPWPLPLIDGGMLNALTVYEQALQNIASQPTHTPEAGVIFASGPPFHNFVAGMWLAKKLGWKLVLDYRDEWTQSPHGFNRADSVNQLWENRCLCAADRVVFTTPSQLDHQAMTFPDLSRDKCLVVHNGWEPEDFLGTGCTDEFRHSETDGRIVLSFFGNLGAWWHPESLLETLAQACELKPSLQSRLLFRFIGNKSPAISELLQRYVRRVPLELIDHLPKLEACRMMVSTDVLLLMNPPSLSRYIPGKIYEYVAAGTPILLYGEGGEMATIINDLGVGQVVPSGSAQALVHAIESLATKHSSVNSNRSTWLATRTRQELAKTMLAKLDQLLTAK